MNKIFFCFMLLICIKLHAQDTCNFICYTYYHLSVWENSNNIFLANDTLNFDGNKLIPEDIKDRYGISKEIDTVNSNLVNLNCHCLNQNIVSSNEFKNIQIDYKLDSSFYYVDSIYKNTIWTSSDSSVRKWNELSSSEIFIKYKKEKLRQRPKLLLFSKIDMGAKYASVSVMVSGSDQLLSDFRGHVYFSIYNEETMVWELENIYR